MPGQPAPVFVKIDEYKDILDIVNVMKTKIAEAKHVLRRINELRTDEDNELEMWNNNITDVERKVEQVDKTLFDIENA
jgi:hypothetical protein